MNLRQRALLHLGKLSRYFCIVLVLAIGIFSLQQKAIAQENSEHSSEDGGPAGLFERASELVLHGKAQEATELLMQLSKRYPHSTLTDDALFLGAELSERDLKNPGKALELYREILIRFPSSRKALASKRRAARLKAVLSQEGGFGEAEERFVSIQLAYNGTSGLLEAGALAREYKDWQQVHRIYQWIASKRRDLGHYGRSEVHWGLALEALGPGQKSIANDIRLSLIETLVMDGRFKQADAQISSLKQNQGLSVSQQAVLSGLSEKLLDSRLAARLSLVALGVATLAILLLLVQLLRSLSSPKELLGALFPLPWEIVFASPFVLLLCGMAFTGHSEVGPTILAIAGGGLLPMWLAAAHWKRVTPLPTLFVLRGLSLVLLANLALGYSALYRNNLIALVSTTVSDGPE